MTAVTLVESEIIRRLVTRHRSFVQLERDAREQRKLVVIELPQSASSSKPAVSSSPRDRHYRRSVSSPRARKSFVTDFRTDTLSSVASALRPVRKLSHRQDGA